ncbi:MAG: NifB/NifX family molybdenum-iron cluster-binding protein [Candidatus Goldiibacteriota bacterium]
MKYAISTDGEYVSQHFGRCPQFTIVDVEDGKITAKEVVDNPGHAPGFLPKFLSEKKVEVIAAGGMGQNALNLFAAESIKPVPGVSGKVSDVIAEIEKGTLAGGESTCAPGKGKGYGLDKNVCEHEE